MSPMRLGQTPGRVCWRVLAVVYLDNPRDNKWVRPSMDFRCRH